MLRASVALAMALNSPAMAQRYLSGPGIALMEVLPPPPSSGSAAAEADRETFRSTRSLETTARWQQATADVDESIPAMLASFSAAAGRPLSLETTPALARLLIRMRGDLSAAVNAVKPVYARQRPFLIDSGAICEPRERLVRSFDYPSGHTSWGTAVALVLAELVPARASEILTRGREYGDSRVICGAHNVSAVAAGRQAAAAVVARLHGDPVFREDLQAARGELDAAAIIMARIADPAGGTIVVAHRGCHAAAAPSTLPEAPENSLRALEHCIMMGVDVVEADVRMTRDGHLIVIHDETVDRTTNGTGRVGMMTLSEIRALRLRTGLGGRDAETTNQQVPLLRDMLDAAAGRVVLNLDIKDAIHAEVAAAVAAAGAGGRIILKATAGLASPPLADLPPFAGLPFIPMMSGSEDLPRVVSRQAAAHRRPVGYEVPQMSLALLPPTVAAARAAGGRVWANTLWQGFIDGIGGDADALVSPDRVWGRLVRAGVSMLQTDHPAALLAFLDRTPAQRR